MSILDFSKTLMYEFWHDIIKQKYQDKAKLWVKFESDLLFRTSEKILDKIYGYYFTLIKPTVYHHGKTLYFCIKSCEKLLERLF